MTVKLGIVGGAGWLGRAIARAVLDAGFTTPEALTLSYRRAEPTGFAGVRLTRDNQDLADRSDVILLSVRPDDWPAAGFDAPGRLVVSVMAGIGLSALSARHHTARVIRALPNAAAEVGASYTPFVAAPAAEAGDRALARRIFETCGLVDEVASEGELDYLSGLTGTGPAYPALMATAMVEDAIARGLDPAIARRAVTTLFAGAGRLMEARGEDPASTVETFMAYRGVTAAGLEAMRTAGLENAVRKGLSAAFGKAVEMGRGG